MLKNILNTLKNIKYGIYTKDLIAEGFSYLIPKAYVFTMYSMKFEVPKDQFVEYLRDIIDILPVFEYDDEFLQETLEISHKWYCYLIENKSLFSSNSSLKSELKKLYKKRTGNIKGFDRFYEHIYNVIQEANNIYTIVFYEPDAIIENESFAPDRDSCFIDSRPDYLTAIRQSKSYYVMIYKNETPVTRVWFVCDETYENAVIFNRYGFRFKNLSQFFSDPSKNELFSGSYKKIEPALGIYINEDLVFTTTNDYDKFVFRLFCPSCGGYVSSNELTLVYDDEDDMYRLKCYHCADLVYSDIYNKYIHEEDAVYSEYYETYIYVEDAVYSEYLDSYILKDDAVYSEYLDSYIHNGDAVKALDDEAGYWVWVPEDLAVYSKYEGTYLIKDQSLYSDYYKTYITKKYVIYSEELKSYIYEMDLKKILSQA